MEGGSWSGIGCGQGRPVWESKGGMMKWNDHVQAVISAGIYFPEALGWPFDPNSGFHPECNGCEPKGQISRDQSWLGQ